MITFFDKVKCIFFVCLISLSFEAKAVTNEIGEFTIKCSALYYLMTNVDGELEQFSNAMSELSEFMGLTSAEIYNINGETLTNGGILNLRNIEADKITEDYKKDPSILLELYGRCDIIRERIASVLIKMPDNQKVDEKTTMRILNNLEIPRSSTMSIDKSIIIEMAIEKAFLNRDDLEIKKSVTMSSKQCNEMASEINADMGGMQIDKSTVLRSTICAGGKADLIYNYRITFDISRRDFESTIPELKENGINAWCTTPELNSLLNQLDSVTSSYVNESGEFVGKLQINKFDCTE